MKKRLFIYIPLLLGAVFSAGFLLGVVYFAGNNEVSKSNHVFLGKKFNKLNDIIAYIESDYVDSISKNKLIDDAIQHILQKLDPHSYYISSDELAGLNEPLEGNFEGVGIQFSLQKDTVIVISPVAGGPSEKVGIKSGDRIIKVNEKLIAGNGISNKEVMDLLRGEKGSQVKVDIQRNGSQKLTPFTITRGKIPIHSIDISYMINSETGFLKLSRFSKTTREEFYTHTQKLKEQGLKKLIFDLRGNGGGFLDAAIHLADEFLDKGKLIVYTEGRNRPRQSFFATDNGLLKDVELVVLIDEGSASASEIIAGAIQDNDRGLVIGRRSFGKGLVQEQSNWPDGSATRLTIARYYTPTGRCIQKPYDGVTHEYESELELESLDDSTKYSTDSAQAYLTPNGKIVYGGGGIYPDILIESDTSEITDYYIGLLYHGIFYQFCFEYADRERDRLLKYNSAANFTKNFTVNKKLVDEFVLYAEKYGIKYNSSSFIKSNDWIIIRIKSGIGRNIWGEEGYFPVINTKDPYVQKALEAL
jgi:carboxyl-terminal processing protease